MKKYPKIIGRTCIQIRVEVDFLNIEKCKQFYIKQKMEFLEESYASENTKYLEFIYYK